MKKTNAARLLDTLKIKYSLIEYEWSEEDLSAEAVASKTGQDIARVFKTLVVRGDKTGIIVACIPGAKEIDLKALAKLSGNKNCELIAVKELLPLTGYQRGGCSPLGMKKHYPVFIDESVLLHPSVYVSAGVRGEQLDLAPSDLVKATQAKTGFIVHQ